MARQMACTDKMCGWIGSEDCVEWGWDGVDPTQDEIMLCPDCMEPVRHAKFWLCIRTDGSNHCRTITCEAETVEDVAEWAERHFNERSGLGGVCDIFGPFDSWACQRYIN
jgi:hypothetical protein